MCFICFVDTGFRKYDRYKHVQGIILREMCYFCVWYFYTVRQQQNDRATGNSYTKFLAILGQSCARRIMKIHLHLQKLQRKVSDTAFYLDTVYVHLETFY